MIAAHSTDVIIATHSQSDVCEVTQIVQGTQNAGLWSCHRKIQTTSICRKEAS